MLIAAAFAGGTASGALSSPLQEKPGEPDIIVRGQRDTRRIQEGLWSVRLSQSYYSGRPLDDPSEMRPAGKDREWRICLGPGEVEALVRILVGEGNPSSSGTTTCSRFTVELGNGKLSGSQTCTGGNLAAKGAEDAKGAGETRRQNVVARDQLTVTGRYSSTSLKLDYQSERAPVSFDPSYAENPDRRRWSVKGERIGECAAGTAQPPADKR